jgi:hypothetical protein
MPDRTTQFIAQSIIDRIPERPNESYEVLQSLVGPRTFGARDPEEEELRNEIEKSTINVGEFVEVYKIPKAKIDGNIRDNSFEYFKVDSGMNINVPQGKIKRIRFYFSIYADGRQSGDAIAIDGFPNDQIERKNILSGKVTLSVNKLLKILPFPEAAEISNAIDIELNPWTIDWAYNKIKVGFSEGLTNNPNWYLSADNVNQSFGCYFTLKKRKSAKKVTAVAKAFWEYEPQSEGVKGWFRRRFNRGSVIFDSDNKSIQIIDSPS